MSELKEKLGGKMQTVNPPVEVVEVETTDSGYVALTTNAMDIISENLKNQTLTYQLIDVIKSPSGGTTAFTVPGLSGDEIQKELTGIILNYTTPQAYWDTPDPVEGTPPVCYSRDSITSVDGKPCMTCTYNDFGSKDGATNAKACKEMAELLFLRPDNIMPIIVRVPVSSKILFQKYMTRLVGQMIPISGVVTRITLEKATNKTGQPYATYIFEVVRQLNSKETALVKAYSQGFNEIMSSKETNPPLPQSAVVEVA